MSVSVLLRCHAYPYIESKQLLASTSVDQSADCAVAGDDAYLITQEKHSIDGTPESTITEFRHPQGDNCRARKSNCHPRPSSSNPSGFRANISKVNRSRAKAPKASTKQAAQYQRTTAGHKKPGQHARKKQRHHEADHDADSSPAASEVEGSSSSSEVSHDVIMHMPTLVMPLLAIGFATDIVPPSPGSKGCKHTYTNPLLVACSPLLLW